MNASELIGQMDVEAAARMLAQRMDYPWDYMTDAGRQEMRKIATDVCCAALRVQPPKDNQ